MDRAPIPPATHNLPYHPPAQLPREERKIPHWQWVLACLVIGSFPLVSTLVGGIRPISASDGPALPESTAKLFTFGLLELAIFAVFFGIAWIIAQPNSDQLRLPWRNESQPLKWGLIYFAILRLGPIFLAMFVLIAVTGVALLAGIKPEQLSHAMQEYQRQNVHPERMVSSQMLNKNPVYLLTVVTFISFVVAALREELWRTFTLTAADHVLPERWTPRRRMVTALILTSVVFGMGHYAIQGILGVVITTVLGLLLGFAILHRKSIWPAVIAHGLFDASTFLILAFTDLAAKVK